MAHGLVWYIERPGSPARNYPAGSRYQIGEVPIQRSVEQLIRVIEAAAVVKDRPGEHRLDDFITFGGPCYGADIRQLLRGKLANYRYRLSR